MAKTWIFFLPMVLILSGACDHTPDRHDSAEIYIWSHNDYEQPRPLFDALERGFQMIEADIHLIDGKLYVAHDPPDTTVTPLLEELYLDPLAEILSRQDDVLPDSHLPFWLVIDVKTEGESTFEVLSDVLRPYHELFTRKKDRQWIEGPVHLLISGNRPVLDEEDPDRIAFIDGRIPDLGKGLSPDLYPVISDNWWNYFSWDGTGDIPQNEVEKLKSFVDEAHREDKRIRFWATPDHEAVWKVLTGAGVDIINVDDLDGVRHFLDGQTP